MQGALPSRLWTGHYEQFQRNYPQQATLEFADGLIRGDGVDGIGVFHIEAEYRVDESAVRMRWSKTYERTAFSIYVCCKAKSLRAVGSFPRRQT